jgi:hypothetical protein
MSKIDGSSVWSQISKNDGVHLTEAAGKVYVESLMANAEAYFMKFLGESS